MSVEYHDSAEVSPGELLEIYIERVDSALKELQRLKDLMAAHLRQLLDKNSE